MMKHILIPAQWTYDDVRIFCRDVLARELSRQGIGVPVTLKVSCSPLFKSGYVRGRLTDGNHGFRITVNLFPFRALQNMQYFCLYAAIAREIARVKLLLELTQVPENVDYRRFLAGCEQLIRGGRNDFRIVRFAVSNPGNYLQGKRNCYQVTLSELICATEGFERALAQMGDALDGQERKRAERILHSLHFANRNVEISYSRKSQPVHRFAAVFLRLARLVDRSPKVLFQFPALRLLFADRGDLRQIREMHPASEAGQAAFYDQILLDLFLLLETDWSIRFEQNPGLRERMGSLAGAYCARCVRYMKNLDSARSCLSDQVLKDNTAMILKNVRRVNALMQRYGMENRTGTVIPL